MHTPLTRFAVASAGALTLFGMTACGGGSGPEGLCGGQHVLLQFFDAASCSVVLEQHPEHAVADPVVVLEFLELV